MGAHAPGGGGGSSAVGCVLARDAPFDIRLDGEGSGAVLWDALYDNLWDLDPLLAIPAGLGLTFAFDGTSSLVVPDEAGIWTFSYFAERATDARWLGSFRLGIGWSFNWPGQIVSGAEGTPFLSGSLSTPLSAGAQLTHTVNPTNEAAADPYTCDQVYLSIVRHG